MPNACREMIGGATSIAWAGRNSRRISVTACVIVSAGSVADGNRGGSLVAGHVVDGPHWLVRSDCCLGPFLAGLLGLLPVRASSYKPLLHQEPIALPVGYACGPWPRCAVTLLWACGTPWSPESRVLGPVRIL